MKSDRGQELWLRFLASRKLMPAEKDELLLAMEADPELRKTVLADQEIDGLLRAFGASDQDAEGFVRGTSDFISAENDENAFVRRVESRMEREGILPGKENPEPAGTRKIIRSDFGNAGSMHYNSNRTPMPGTINLDGSEEDFARLLVYHRIINKDQLQKAMEDRQSKAAKGASLEPLRDTLLRTKTVISPLIFDVLRVASKVVETCTKCSAVHHIHYYHPHSRYFCTYCKGPLRVTDPGQSLKWQPGELAASVKEISSEFPLDSGTKVFRAIEKPTTEKPPVKAPISNPLDDPSVVPMSMGDETMLDTGFSPKAAKPAAPKADAPAKPPPRPAALPPQKPAPLPALGGENTVTMIPGGGETMLDMGVTPRTSSKPPAADPETPKAPAAPSGLPSWMNDEPAAAPSPQEGITPRTSSRPAPLPKLEREGEEKKVPAAGEPAPVDRSIGMVPGGGETMLDMGFTPRTSSRPVALPKLEKEGEQKKDAAPLEGAPIDRSIGMVQGGGETMLDMGLGQRPPAAPLPVDPTTSIVPGAGAGETMLDMGPLGGHTPPKSHVSGMTTSLFGSKKSLPTGMPKAPPETPKLPPGSATANPSYDVTTRAGKFDPTTTPPSGTTGSSSTLDKTQIQQTTPKTGQGQSSAALANAKALPPEVAVAAKDPNRVFGKYVLMSELGRGGAGVVYKAWDTLILQYVALKFIRNQDDGESDSTSGSSQIEEFQREARMSVKLRHPNIVRIYELGCMSNRYYLAMEYIEGGTLLAMIHGGKDRNQKTRFNSDPIKFLKIMQNISLAVDYAHTGSSPIIHRDLKPHNVLVDTRGNPYVVDFGLAKEVDTGEGATLTGVVKGTPTYMAPEQAEGRNRDVDARTDVYSLGAILYEMLTGRPPFLGESVPEILRKIATELPERPNDVIVKNAIAEAASSTANSKTKTKPLMVPKPLETICLKAIEKGKADRYQSAKEFAEDIERYLKDEDILAQEPGLWRRCRRKVRQNPITSGALAAVLLAGLSVGIALKTFGKSDGLEGKKLVESIVDRGTKALQGRDWASLRGAADDLSKQDKAHPKIAEFEKALKDYRDIVEKTEREWSADLDRIRREPLSQVISSLREKYRRVPELKPKLMESLRLELVALQRRVLEESRRLVGSGARPAWVEEIIKKSAKEAREQAEMLIGLAKDADFKYPTDPELEEARDGLGRVIIYQGTWTLQVNVAPYAEVFLSRSDKEVATDFTPLGMQGLEVVGSSYIVELFWPSKENPKVKLKEEVKDLHHGQTVVIRGDVSKEMVKQERR